MTHLGMLLLISLPKRRAALTPERGEIAAGLPWRPSQSGWEVRHETTACALFALEI